MPRRHRLKYEIFAKQLEIVHNGVDKSKVDISSNTDTINIKETFFSLNDKFRFYVDENTLKIQRNTDGVWKDRLVIE